MVFKIAPIQFSCSRLQLIIDKQAIRDPKLIELLKNEGFEDWGEEFLYKRDTPRPSDFKKIIKILYELAEKNVDIEKVILDYEQEVYLRSSSCQVSDDIDLIRHHSYDAEVIFIPIELTDVCFRKCVYCYAKTKIVDEKLADIGEYQVNEANLRSVFAEALGLAYQKIRETKRYWIRIIVGIGGGEPLLIHNLYSVVLMLRRELAKFSRLVESLGKKLDYKITITTSALHKLTCNIYSEADGYALTYVQPALQKYTTKLVNEYLPIDVKLLTSRWKNAGIHFIVTRNTPVDEITDFLRELKKNLLSYYEMMYVHVTPLHYIPVVQKELVPDKKDLYSMLFELLDVVPDTYDWDTFLLLDVCTIKSLFKIDICSKAIEEGNFIQIKFDGIHYYVQRLKTGQCPMTETYCPIENL